MQVLSISDTDQNSLSDIQSPEAPDLNVQSNLMLTAQRRNSFIPRRCKSKVMVSQPLKNAYKPSESIEKTKVSSRFRRQATRRGSITYSGQAMSHNHHRSVTHYSRSQYSRRVFSPAAVYFVFYFDYNFRSSDCINKLWL